MMKKTELRKLIREQILKEGILGSNHKLRHALEIFMREYLLEYWTTAGYGDVTSAIQSMKIVETKKKTGLVIDMYMKPQSDEPDVQNQDAHFTIMLIDREPR